MPSYQLRGTISRQAFVSGARMAAGFALRSAASICVRNKQVCALAVICLGIGVGASCAFFNIADTILARSLPLPGSRSLVGILDSNARDMSPVSFLALAERSQSFESVAAYSGQEFNLASEGTPEAVVGAVVTPSFFHVLGCRPLLGRGFLAKEEASNVVISLETWKTLFNGRVSVVGERASLDGKPFVVIGVMDADCRLPLGARLWVTPGRDPAPRWPFGSDDSDVRNETSTYLGVIGRLRDSYTLTAGQADADRISEQLRVETGEDDRTWHLEVRSLQRVLFGNIRGFAVAIAVAGCLLCVVAGVSVTNVLLAHSLRTSRDSLLRVALGARRTDLVRERLALGALLAAASVPVSAGVATGLMTIVARVATPASRLAGFLQVGWRDAATIVTGTVITSCAAALIAGGAGSTEKLMALVRAGNSGLSRRRSILREGLVALQICLALPLLTASLGLAVSLRRMGTSAAGFDLTNVLTFRVPLSAANAPTMARAVAFHERLQTELRLLPTVASAGLATIVPLGGSRSRSTFGVWGAPGGRQEAWVDLVWVSSGYFRTLGIPLLRGRQLQDTDDETGTPVAIVDETFASRFLDKPGAVGAGIWTAPSRNQRREIVGIVGGVHGIQVDEPAVPTVYLPCRQASGAYASSWGRQMWYVLKTKVPAETTKDSIRHLVAATDRAQPIADLRTMEERTSDSMRGRALVAALVGSLAAIALVLALIGVAGVVGQSVMERRVECAVRAALGATPASLLALVAMRMAVAILVGMSLGVILTAAAWHILAPLTGNARLIESDDLLGTAVTLCVIGGVTTLLTARQVVRSRIAESLRYG